MKRRSFKAKGRDYEVRAIVNNGDVIARAFDDKGRAASGPYTVPAEIAQDMEALGKGDPVETIMNAVEEDIVMDRAAELAAAVASLGDE